MVETVIKRSGKKVKFNPRKIFTAISKANRDLKEIPGAHRMSRDDINGIVDSVVQKISDHDCVEIEVIQDNVELQLMENGFYDVSKAFIIFRNRRKEQKEATKDLVKSYEKLLFADSKKLETKRENANINGDCPMAIMLKVGTESMKMYADEFVIPQKYVEADKEAIIHIHDKDFSLITVNCLTQDLSKTFKGGFDTGHGKLREPQSIRSYSSLACIAIQCSQNDCFGGQAVSGFDFTMAEGVKKSFRKAVIDKIINCINFTVNPKEEHNKETLSKYIDKINFDKCSYIDETCSGYESKTEESVEEIYKALSSFAINKNNAKTIYSLACKAVIEETHQAMESLVHNLNTLHSRAGSQVPFSSINYGMNTTPEGRLVIRELLNATWDGLGDGETPIFPIQIFQLKAGVNYNPEDPNYDLFKQACKTSAKRLFPNFVSVDADFNLQYYKPDDYRTFASSMGCRTRVIGNVNGEETFTSRGNFAFVTINLPMLALMAESNIEEFFKLFDKYIKLSKEYLEIRYKVIAEKKVKNFPFVMGEGIYMGSENLGPEDGIEPVLKNFSLSIGYCGLAECLKALIGKHHGESEEAQQLGLAIIGHLREMTDKFAEQTHMNWSTFASPAESTCGTFLRAIRNKFGVIEGISDHEYLTNSNHVPVYYKTSAMHKIEIEAPYHKLTNAGNISYIEMDGDPLKNLPAFEKIVRAMHDANMGYFSINHAVDRDPVCGYTGIIDNECPKCHRHEDGIYHIRVKV